MMFIMALLIIAVGGSIRINDAGESCPEWPTCFGTWHFDISEAEQGDYWDTNPDQIDSRGDDHRYTTFQIFVEWFHRLLVGIIALPIIANVFVSKKRSEIYGDFVYKMSLFSLVLLTVQAIAGYVTVRFDNADWTVALHLSLASIFAAGLLWQYMSMKISEGASWNFLNAPETYTEQHMRRMNAMAGAVGVLLVLGAWVSSSAGGQYNQSCSVGFPNGWPKCQGTFLPSLDSPGIFIQMIHRIGAVVVGLVLVIGVSNLRVSAQGVQGANELTRFGEITTGLWMLNIMVGGSYIVFAKIGEFPEWLSLIHLIVGVAAFLSAIFATFSFSFARSYVVPESIGVEQE